MKKHDSTSPNWVCSDKFSFLFTLASIQSKAPNQLRLFKNVSYFLTNRNNSKKRIFFAIDKFLQKITLKDRGVGPLIS